MKRLSRGAGTVWKLQTSTPPPPIEGVLLFQEPPKPAPQVAAAPEPAPPAEPAPATLPKTGSVVPLVGLLGLLFSGASFGVRLLQPPEEKSTV